MIGSGSSTVGDFLGFLLGEDWADTSLLCWPPDTFAVCQALLEASGGYLWVRRSWPPEVPRDWKPPAEEARERQDGRNSRRELDWAVFIRSVGTEWAERFEVEEGVCTPPPVVRAWWAAVVEGRQTSVQGVEKDRELCYALLQLSAAADEASAGCGIPKKVAGRGARNHFRRELSHQLFAGVADDSGSTLCRQVDAAKLAVLPKMHTPQSGLTIRSMSHHLALCMSCGVRAAWYDAVTPPESLEHALNLLVVPWPLEVPPSSFQPVRARPRGQDAPHHRFFRFERRGSPVDRAELVRTYLRRARELVGTVHGVVFPEMAVSTADHEILRRQLRDEILFLVTGVYDPPRDGKKPGRNYASLSLRYEPLSGVPTSLDIEQAKHHAWYLDDGQIRQYGLGGLLDPRYRWREDIELPRRQIHFTALAGWLSMAVLICEDLARPDPVANLIRSVGPNLLIALLQDGPQLESRWPGRYATVLADDPGCSVLTLTSLGMAELSRPPGKPISRKVALWKDKNHAAREIELPPGAGALVLSLVNCQEEEWSVDGRSDGGAAGFLSLAGVHPLSEVTVPRGNKRSNST